MGILRLSLACFFCFLPMGFAANHYNYTEVDFYENHPVQVDGNKNPFQLPPGQYEAAVEKGRLHAILYPVDNTRFLPPSEPVRRVLEEKSFDPLKQLLKLVFQQVTKLKSMNDLFAWLGLHPYPKETDTGVYSVPYPNGVRPDFLMGYTPMQRNGVQAFTLACATCHSGSLFGKTVLGMTNRFPRSYSAFSLAHKFRKTMKAEVFTGFGVANREEAELLEAMGKALMSVGPKSPSALGLDVSISFTSRGLARREPDEWASLSPYYEKNPRPDWHDKNVAESKPPVWWNVKYKNKWGPDGSFVSGNPVFTNILWNEIGRGADLRDVDAWMDNNYEKYIELTTAVFSSEAPKYTDFFAPETIDLASAKRGEQLFLESCSGCHGTYKKNWSLDGSDLLPLKDQLQTFKVLYPSNTRVMDVGTDPWRRMGTTSVERMNQLAIQKKHRTEFKTQKGYVPQPLVGIWARWPYFHNNSVPSLCAVLTAAKDRPKYYYAGAANNPQTDFDQECNGYPVGNRTPRQWKMASRLFNTKKTGLSNAGHDEGIFLKAGREIFAPSDKKDIIQFLKTL
jgi:hypothetical protein